MMDGGGYEHELLADGVQCSTLNTEMHVDVAGLGAAAVVEWRPHLFNLSWYRRGTLQKDKEKLEK